ncbi:MAG: DUF177 domain-containing protein [Bacteroidota bacterium]|nr:DUF177 domain-containing protein [Bacteroidota bacterium]
MMKPNKAVIQFGGLGFGTHHFEFEITDKFFESLEYSEIHKANVLINVDFVKQNNVMTLNFRLSGTVGITCDRCVGEYDLPIENTDSMYIKNGDVSESNDSIIVLPHGETSVDLIEHFYQLIAVALPIRRVPCEIDAELYKCDEEVLKKLKDLSVEEEPGEKNQDTNVWEELKKIKFNNN